MLRLREGGIIYQLHTQGCRVGNIEGGKLNDIEGRHTLNDIEEGEYSKASRGGILKDIKGSPPPPTFSYHRARLGLTLMLMAQTEMASSLSITETEPVSHFQG